VVDLADLSFEEAFQRLEAAVAELEGGTLTVEEMVARFEHGMMLVAMCRQKLDAAQIRVSSLARTIDDRETNGLPDSADDPEG
jgi:exodeoxyribonuclease VII small subunit